MTLPSDEKDGNGRFAYLDGSGQAIITGTASEWSHFEQSDFDAAAGIPEGLASPPKIPALRADGCEIEDAKWADPMYLYIAALVGGAIAFALASDLIPTWLGWSALAPLLIYVAAVLLSGVTATPRDFDEFQRRTEEEFDRAGIADVPQPPRKRRR